VKVSCKNGLYRSSLDFLSSLAKIVVLINIIVIAMATCTAWLDIPSLHLQRWLSPLAITLRVGSVFFFNSFCLALYSFTHLIFFIQLHTVRIYIYIFICKNLFLATLESDDGYLCAKNCHGTVALIPLVGCWLVGWLVGLLKGHHHIGKSIRC